MVGGEELEEVVADAGFLLVDDGVAARRRSGLGRHHASKGNSFRPELERIGHGQRVGMAGNRNQIFRAKDTGLFEDAASYLSESQAMFGGLKTLHTASLLDWLNGHTPHCGLLKGKVDDVSQVRRRSHRAQR